MIRIGDYNSLEVEKEVDFGLYLKTEGDSILLPKKYVPQGISPGDTLEVFIYTDSEDRLIATTIAPKAKVGDIKALEVKDVNKFGAFMDWGLEKDLMVPYNEQHKKMVSGRKYVVKVLLDPRTRRVIGTSKLSAFLSKKIEHLKEGEEVDLTIYDRTDLGYTALINGKYSGMLYYNEVFRKIDVGDELKGYIKQLRSDGKIDLTLNKQGKESVDDAQEIILTQLKENKGFLPLNDESTPEEVKDKLQMSKKTFKKAIGGLYKLRLIDLTASGIELKQEN